MFLENTLSVVFYQNSKIKQMTAILAMLLSSSMGVMEVPQKCSFWVTVYNCCNFMELYTSTDYDCAISISPVHKMLGNFSTTFDFFGNFSLVEQLSVHRATFKLKCLNNDSHSPTTSGTITDCIIQLVSRFSLPSFLIRILSYTLFL